MKDVYQFKLVVITEKGTGLLFSVSEKEAVVEFDHSYLVGFDPSEVKLRDHPELDLLEYCFNEQWL